MQNWRLSVAMRLHSREWEVVRGRVWTDQFNAKAVLRTVPGALRLIAGLDPVSSGGLGGHKTSAGKPASVKHFRGYYQLCEVSVSHLPLPMRKANGLWPL